MTRSKQAILSVLTIMVWLLASFNCGVCHAFVNSQSSKADHSCCDDNGRSESNSKHERHEDGDPCSGCVSCISSISVEQVKASTPQLTSVDASLSLINFVSVFSFFDFASTVNHQKIPATAPPDQNLASQMVYSLVISPNAPPAI